MPWGRRRPVHDSVTVYNRLDKVVLEVGAHEVPVTPADARGIASRLREAADRAEQTPPDEYLGDKL